jgi:hypothetical protein
MKGTLPESAWLKDLSFKWGARISFDQREANKESMDVLYVVFISYLYLLYTNCTDIRKAIWPLIYYLFYYIEPYGRADSPG